jgi:hypothetical protein
MGRCRWVALWITTVNYLRTARAECESKIIKFGTGPPLSGPAYTWGLISTVSFGRPLKMRTTRAACKWAT